MRFVFVTWNLVRPAVAASFLLFLSAGGAAAQTPAQRPPDGTYVYNWSQGGTLVGQSTIVFLTKGNQLSVQTNTNLPGIQLAGATIAYSTGLEFLSYSGYASVNGLNTSIDLSLRNGAVVGTTRNQSISNTVNVSQLAAVPVVAVDDGTMGTFPVLPAQMRARGANSFQLIPIASGIAGFVTYGTSSAGPYPAGVPTSDVVASFGSNTTLWYDPATLAVDQFARGALVAVLVSRP